MRLKTLMAGAACYTPLRSYVGRKTRGTNGAAYCHSVWLRHMTMLADANLSTSPEVIGELGPGDSLGIGLAGLLTGASKFYALDVIRFSAVEKNLEILRDLVDLFKNRQSLLDERAAPDICPRLPKYEFPDHLLTEERLAHALHPDRIAAIEEAVRTGNGTVPNGEEIQIQYIVPWDKVDLATIPSPDLIYSQAVLEHVNDLTAVHKAIYAWLKPGGAMSHSIDFRSHGFTNEWNGHWCYSERYWQLITGRRPYTINRLPCSTHVEAHRRMGLDIRHQVRVKLPNRLSQRRVAPEFLPMSEDDLETAMLYILSQKTSAPIDQEDL